MRFLSLVLLTVAVVGCADFDPRSLLKGPRVVGVIAEPPEIGPVDAVTLTSIEYGEGTAERTWTVCLISLGVFADFACLDDALEIELPDATPMVGLNFGPDGIDIFGLLSTFAGGRDVADLMAECGDACLGPDGQSRSYFDAQVKLHTRWDDGTEMTTFKAVRVRLDDTPRNENPDISALRINDQEVSDGVPPGATVSLKVSNDLESLQTYVDAGGRSFDEEITLTWYSTAGEFSSPITFGDDLDTELKLPAEIDAEEVFILVVGRDGRGGTDYVSGVFPIER